MKKYSIYYWKFVMGMIVVTNLITLFIMNQGSKSLEKEGEVVLFMFIAALLMMLIEQWKLKTSKEFPLFILGEMMFAIMLTPIFFMAYRYMTKVFSLVWMFHLSNSFISLARWNDTICFSIYQSFCSCYKSYSICGSSL